MFAASLAALTLATVAMAQDATIQVGASSGNAFVFTPTTLNATTGSVITFNFSGVPGFHSVTQSNFSSPCEPMAGGFDSGFVQVGVSGKPAALPSWNLTITNQSIPIWFHCKQLSPQPHCIAGMVGGINVPGSGQFSFSAFQQAARAVSGMPGQQEGGLVGVGASASAPPSPLTVAGVSGVGNPTASAAASGSAAATGSSASGSAAASASGSGSGSGTGSAAGSAASSTSTSTSSGANMLTVNGLIVLGAAVMGIAFA